MFRDAFESTEAFARQVLSHCHDERERVGRRSVLSPHATEALRHILRGRATLYSSRQLDADVRNSQLLGSQIHATETILKQLTLQQLELMKESHAAAIEFHHKPELTPEGFALFAHHLYVADTIVCGTQIGCPLTGKGQPVDQQHLSAAGLTQEMVQEVARKLPILARLYLS